MSAAWRQVPYGSKGRWLARVRGHHLVVEPSVSTPTRYTWHIRDVLPAKAWGPYADLITAQMSAETWAETHPRQRQRSAHPWEDAR